MARGRKRGRRKKRRSVWSVIFPVLLLILLLLLGIIAFWVMSGQEGGAPKIPILQNQSSADGKGTSSNWNETPVSTENSADEIARLKEQYETGRIDYGGVKKGLARLDAGTLGESDLQAYQNLSAQAEQDFSDTVAGYISQGYYSEAAALLNRISATLPGDEVTASLISQYQAELGM